MFKPNVSLDSLWIRKCGSEDQHQLVKQAARSQMGGRVHHRKDMEIVRRDEVLFMNKILAPVGMQLKSLPLIINEMFIISTCGRFCQSHHKGCRYIGILDFDPVLECTTHTHEQINVHDVNLMFKLKRQISQCFLKRDCGTKNVIRLYLSKEEVPI